MEKKTEMKSEKAKTNGLTKRLHRWMQRRARLRLRQRTKRST
jgi:hypothetical protein